MIITFMLRSLKLHTFYKQFTIRCHLFFRVSIVFNYKQVNVSQIGTQIQDNLTLKKFYKTITVHSRKQKYEVEPFTIGFC